MLKREAQMTQVVSTEVSAISVRCNYVMNFLSLRLIVIEFEKSGWKNLTLVLHFWTESKINRNCEMFGDFKVTNMKR